MARVFCGIAITPTKLCHILLRTQHTRHNQLMHGHPFHIETIEERLTNVLKEYSSTRHKIRDTGVERIYMVIRISPHINQLTLARLSILTILHRSDAPLVGGHQLNSIGIRESSQIVGHRIDAVTMPLNSLLLGWCCESLIIGRSRNSLHLTFSRRFVFLSVSSNFSDFVGKDTNIFCNFVPKFKFYII